MDLDDDIPLVDTDAPIGSPLQYIINHVLLPPKLPQHNDGALLNEVGLTKAFQEALISFTHVLPEDNQDAWIPLHSMLDILLDDGNLGNPLRSSIQNFMI